MNGVLKSQYAQQKSQPDAPANVFPSQFILSQFIPSKSHHNDNQAMVWTADNKTHKQTPMFCLFVIARDTW